MKRFRMQASTTFGRTHLQDDRLLLTHARPKDRGHVIKWSVFPLAVAPRKECFFAKNQFPDYSAPPLLVKRTRMAPINLRSVLPGLLLAQSLFMSLFTLVTCNNVRIARSYRLFEFITDSYFELSVPGDIGGGLTEQYRYADCKKLAENDNPARWKNCDTFAMIARGEFSTPTLSYIYMLTVSLSSDLHEQLW